MLEEPDQDLYQESPCHTPAPNPQSAIPNPLDLVQKIFEYTVDAPGGTLSIANTQNMSYYYHQKFRSIPDLMTCLEDDYVCFFEAEMQWERDMKVNQEIVKIVQERLTVCTQWEGESHFQNCAGEYQKFKEVAKAYQTKYGDLGAYGNARKCLMKQKQRMITERTLNVVLRRFQ
uniref:NADH dehydrogenase [ubiquinone] 1 beta subcomplex subunit 10-like n=1 Tax=Euleptes europaea TaxID=460621 RepID=UPI0025400673|nr:NADH dehydrogenase [ubiquinone] 1 beta subcomplex subunit 10-like [Euleptes europaea]